MTTKCGSCGGVSITGRILHGVIEAAGRSRMKDGWAHREGVGHTGTVVRRRDTDTQEIEADWVLCGVRSAPRSSFSWLAMDVEYGEVDASCFASGDDDQ